MQRFWSILAVGLGRRAGLVSAVGLVLTGVLGFGITKLDFATDQDSYLNRDDQVAVDNVEYQGLFGGQAMVTIFELDEGTDLVDFLSPENQAVLAGIEEELVAADGIRAVVSPRTALEFSDILIQTAPDGSPSNPDDPTSSIAGGALAHAAGLGEGGPELQEAPGTPEAEARTEDSLATVTRLGEIPAAERTMDNPEWRRFLLYDNREEIRKSLRPFFPDSGTAQVVTRLDGNMSIEDEGVAADLITATFDDAPIEGARSTTVGSPTLLQDINDYLRGGILSLGAIAVGAMVLALILLFNVRWRLLPMLVIVLGVVWAFGLAGYLGIPLSLVTISGLPVLLALGIDYAIQVHARVEEEVIVDREEHPIQETARNLGPALVVVIVGAVVAFAALLFARVPMIRDFGLLMLVGIAVIGVCSIVVTLSVLGAREHRSPTTGRDMREGRLSRMVVGLGSLPSWLAVPFAVGSVVVLAGGVLVEDSLTIKADPIEWVDQSSETIRKLDRLRDATGSTSELGVYVRSDDAFTQDTVTYVHTLAYCALGQFPDEAADDALTRGHCEDEHLPLQVVEEGGEERAALLTASSVVTTVSYLLEIPGATPLPPRAEDVRAAWEVAPESIQRFTATEDGDALNLIFRTGYSSLSDGDEVVRAFRDTEGAPEGTTAVPSGLAVVGVGLLDNIQSNRAELTYLAIGAVGLFLLVRLRSLFRSAMALVPVLVATGLSSLLAFALGLELSPMTAVGGPLVVAVCTEFTVLILLRFLEERRRGFTPRDAARVASARTGRAFIVSAVTTILGIGVIAASSLPLLRDFGAVVTLNVSIALLSALVILPPMLVWADAPGREWVSRRLVPDDVLASSRQGSVGTEPPTAG